MANDNHESGRMQLPDRLGRIAFELALAWLPACLLCLPIYVTLSAYSERLADILIIATFCSIPLAAVSIGLVAGLGFSKLGCAGAMIGSLWLYMIWMLRSLPDR